MERPQANSAANSGHYREMAQNYVILPESSASQVPAKSSLTLASRYERRADNLDARTEASSHENHC